MEDDRVAILETQLAQAKQIAEEADRKYEEVKIIWQLLPALLSLWDLVLFPLLISHSSFLVSLWLARGKI